MDSFFNEFAECLTYGLVHAKGNLVFRIHDKKFFPKEYISLLDIVANKFIGQFENSYAYTDYHLQPELYKKVYDSIKDIFRKVFSNVSIGEVVCVVSIGRRESVHSEEFEVKKVFKSYIEAKNYYLKLHNNKKWYEEVRIDVLELQ